jgi:hypothetical protein
MAVARYVLLTDVSEELTAVFFFLPFDRLSSCRYRMLDAVRRNIVFPKFCKSVGTVRKVQLTDLYESVGTPQRPVYMDQSFVGQFAVCGKEEIKSYEVLSHDTLGPATITLL